MRRILWNKRSRPTNTDARVLLAAAGVCVGLSLAAGGLSGCENQPVRTSAADSEPVNTGLGRIGEDDGLALPDPDDLVENEEGAFGSVSDQIAESARQLNVYFANIEIDGVDEVDPASRVRVPLEGSETQQAAQVDPVSNSVSDPETAQNSTTIQDPTIEPNAQESAAHDTTNAKGGVRVSLLGGSGDETENNDIESAEPAPEQPTQAAQSEPEPVEPIDPQVRKQELARELAAILSSLASTSDDPGAAALALAGLEVLLPDETGSLVEEGVLSDGELASLDAARAFLRSMSSEGSLASPGQLSSGLEEIQAGLHAWTGMVVTKSALCTRVDGFGRYETFDTYRFVAGRAQPAIVYVELERFGQREFVGPDGQPRFETKLSQRLELYHVADDLNTWNRAAETVTDVTRNHLRDYYLINQITLPANLGVGRYHLKVVMRDLVSEKVAESIIPIEIVAR